jgi:Domain of unknown function (DUF4166)
MMSITGSFCALPAALDEASEAEHDGDRRFSDLLTPAEWMQLPADVRRRFSKRLESGAAIYSGHVSLCRISAAGWLLAQILRVIGAPLPLSDMAGMPTVVSVTEEGASGGQNWTRIYGRPSGFPQVIHSTKRFSGPTGLEEYVGTGVSMALTLSVEKSALFFNSAGYFIQFGHWSMRLPRWLEPGQTTVSHREIAEGAFLFTLHVQHPWLGTLVHQEAVYREVEPCSVASY